MSTCLMVSNIDHLVCVAEKQPNYCFHHQQSLIRSWVYGALKIHSVPWKHLRIHFLSGLYVSETMKDHPVSWRHLCIHTLNGLYVFEAIECHGDSFAFTH